VLVQLESLGPEFSITPEVLQARAFPVKGAKPAFQEVLPQPICLVSKCRAFVTTEALRMKTKRDSARLPKIAGDTLRDRSEM